MLPAGSYATSLGALRCYTWCKNGVKRKQSQSALHSTWRTEDVFLEKKNQASPSMQKKTIYPIILRDLKFLRYWWSCLTCIGTFCWFPLHDSWMMKFWFCCHFVSLNRNSQLFQYNHVKIISHYCFYINPSFVLSYYNTTENMYTTYIFYQ
jgi:hypothetical protein